MSRIWMEEIRTTCSERALKSKLAIVDEKTTLVQKEQCGVAEWRIGDEEKRGEGHGSCRGQSKRKTKTHRAGKVNFSSGLM